MRSSSPRRAPARVALACLASLALAAAGPWARPAPARVAHSSEEREYPVKAAFLLNFIRYTTWPDRSFQDGSSPIVVTVVGKDPFGDVLESTFRGEEAHGRKIQVARVKEVPEEITGHVVFCGELSRTARAELLRRCQKRPLLLVGETAGFAEAGACINFFLQDKKTRFEINPEAVAASGLEISPAVLKLAKIVRTRKEDE